MILMTMLLLSFAILDPVTYSEVYDDMFFEKISTALIKRQWEKI